MRKKIKIKLIQRNIRYNYSHDLKYLLNLLEGISIDKDLSIRLNKLTSYAVDCRYDYVEIEYEDVVEAFDTVDKVMATLDNF